MNGRGTKGKIAVVVLAVACIAGVVAWQAEWIGSNTEEAVEVTRDGGLPKAKDVEDGDLAGASVVRAFLKGAVACSGQGKALMRDLSLPGQRAEAAGTVFTDACNGNGGWREGIDAQFVWVDKDLDGLDANGRAHWKVQASGDGLPSNVTLRLADRRSGGWGVHSVCVGPCND